MVGIFVWLTVEQTHTILQVQKYFSSLKMAKANVSTISGTVTLIEGSGRANIILPGGTSILIKDAFVL